MEHECDACGEIWMETSQFGVCPNCGEPSVMEVDGE